ncbi:class I SAM-dependent methyltransferase [Caldanaerobius polysaccharolyticus]|nr:class I SAM-dependent methyltransferase [Caldanaerobius polysaccharolyticus]
MLDRAKIKAEQLNKKVSLELMDVQHLNFPDESFDAVITTCVFCSVPDPLKGLMEIRRVLKRGGELIMLEHVRSNVKVLGRVMDMLNPLVVGLYGANINRNTVENVKKAGFDVYYEKNLALDIVKLIKARPIK